MCQSGATVYTVTLKHKTQSKVRAIRLRKGDKVFSKEGAKSLVLDTHDEDWAVKTVTESFDVRWME